MADAVDSKSAGETRVGSTPTFGTIKIMMKKKHILFASIHNSGRSKMAEYFFNYYVNKLNKKNLLSCSSAWKYTKNNVNTNVQIVMKEVEWLMLNIEYWIINKFQILYIRNNFIL